ncbi:hypothetical protein A2662_04225 [Candidatus Giovannonibacteria bacterium RIFCSPHIGHO2_01_FULL_45_33]|uniref:Glycosyltransferase RgtA/B/C/D-like domain-containing protein n=1 Tax=Candidatus Giovannonibacteria bacterium RIFCSPLOWO2_01_FULL_45_34 TaxID=1798351 RepID=A0A1F5WZ86_9BACT|nr:MAG: hypothetical protein A2662_04225 [Candidatus Giovannonibacteria bacterium RIFCSPHIGHO2_01_FULL_45_33]OGF69437.1 MAG: hypothetical protein A3C73_03840 [Candidatus Giovannonibacteria bacterium RIFCSPHIGHO2_02_FULL_44_11]OGF80937.1 MAG: hypothetical protein A2930_02530 [Candidatus Giovannonibacteria bacterium RIFCSPLOWO2_01_FULL_45_34]
MKKSLMGITVILFLAVFLRFYDIKNVPPGLWSDEAMNGINIIQALEGGQWKVFYHENFGREGLFINIQALFVKALGHEPWVLRLPSAIFGVLTVLGLYLMTKELFSWRVAAFSAFFMATSFWHINFSRIGFRAIMAPFFLVWGFYLLLKAIRKATKPQILQDFSQRGGGDLPAGRQGLSNSPAGEYAGLEKFGSKTLFAFLSRPDVLMAFAGLVFGLGVHSYIAYRVAPLIALYPLWKFYKNQAEAVEPPLGGSTAKFCAPCLIVLFIFMALVTTSPLLIYFAQNPADFFGRTSAISIFNSPNPIAQFSENIAKTLQMFNFFGDFNWRHNFRGASQLWWPVGILFLLGIWETLRRIKFAHKFILFWFFIMMLPVVISSEGLPHALRAIVLIPPAMIFAALGLELLIGRINMKFEKWEIDFPERKKQIHRIYKELKIVLFVFFIAVASNSFNQYFFRWAPKLEVYGSFHGDITKIAHWLNNEPPNIKKYVVTNNTDSVDLTERPQSFMPVVFITDTYFESKQRKKNIYYLGKNELDKIDCSAHCVIIPVESNPSIYEEIRQKVPGINIKSDPGFIILEK